MRNKEKLKKRNLCFNRTKKDIKIDYDNVQNVMIVPGFERELPNYTYSVITDHFILITLYSIIASMNKKRKDIRFVSCRLNKLDCRITIKSNLDNYLEFCRDFIALSNGDIENIEMEG